MSRHLHMREPFLPSGGDRLDLRRRGVRTVGVRPARQHSEQQRLLLLRGERQWDREGIGTGGPSTVMVYVGSIRQLRMLIGERDMARRTRRSDAGLLLAAACLRLLDVGEVRG